MITSNYSTRNTICVINGIDLLMTILKIFFKLGIRANMVEKESHKVSRYLQGLNSPIRERLNEKTCWNVQEARSRALKVEI